MANIRINTDLMRQLGGSFIHLSDEINNTLLPQIRNGVSQLEADWQGVSRQRFETLFHDWTTYAYHLTDLGYQIGQHLERTADAFSFADQNG